MLQASVGTSGNMQVELDSSYSLKTDQMIIEHDPYQFGNDSKSLRQNNTQILDFNAQLTTADLLLLCDLFYLPFEHGTYGIQLLQEFNWLKSNAQVLCHKSNKQQDFRKVDVSSAPFSLFLYKS